MNPISKKNGPDLESKIQLRVVNRLSLEKWYCVVTHGNAHQAGFPDIFACSTRFGIRWIEVKRPVGYRFTNAQLTVFTKFASKNVGIWVMTHEDHYSKLFKASNWYTYLNYNGITLKDSVKRIKKYGPEGVIQDQIIDKLSKEDWFCIETYGSVFQTGLPDIFACHKQYGTRWIECKNPAGYRFTPAQMDVFPNFTAQGVGIWILTSPDQTNRLFEAPNWHWYLK